MDSDANNVIKTTVRGDAISRQGQKNTAPQTTQKMKLVAVVAAIVLVCALASSIATLVMVTKISHQVNIQMQHEDLENLLNSSTTPTTTTAEPAPISCSTSSVNGRQVLRSGEGIYCEDRWTVFQRRFDGNVDFQLNWNAYKNGFGNLSGEFWLGLDKINLLTSQRNCRLRVDLRDFDNEERFAEYSSFSVDDESDNYRLHVTGYNGTAGDSLNDHNNHPFSTFDKDHDSYPGNCATNYGEGSGGWWFRSCFASALNAVWGRPGGFAQNINWSTWKGVYAALKATTMKLRCD